MHESILCSAGISSGDPSSGFHNNFRQMLWSPCENWADPSCLVLLGECERPHWRSSKVHANKRTRLQARQDAWNNMSTGGRSWFAWPASGRPREPNKEEFEKVHPPGASHISGLSSCHCATLDCAFALHGCLTHVGTSRESICRPEMLTEALRKTCRLFSDVTRMTLPPCELCIDNFCCQTLQERHCFHRGIH